MEDDIVNWWAQKIDVRDLRAFARDLIDDYGDSDDEDDKMIALAAQDLLDVLKGKRGKMNYIEAGGWDGDDHTKALLGRAGNAILNDDRSIFTECRWYD